MILYDNNALRDKIDVKRFTVSSGTQSVNIVNYSNINFWLSVEYQGSIKEMLPAFTSITLPVTANSYIVLEEKDKDAGANIATLNLYVSLTEYQYPSDFALEPLALMPAYTQNVELLNFNPSIIPIESITGDKIAPNTITADNIAVGTIDEAKMKWSTHLLTYASIADNSPQLGYIAWNGLYIYYKGVKYGAYAGSTNKKYIWWEYANPNTLCAGDTFPTLTDDDVLIFLNKLGTHLTVPSATVIDGSLIVPESIHTQAIAANAITSINIAAGAITADKIAAGAITADKIAAGAITADKIYAQTLSGITLTGVTLRSTGDTWIGQDIYLYGDNQGYTGGSIYFGITDPPALAPLIYGYEDGTRNNLDFYVTNGTITFETMQFNLNCNIHTTGDVYCYNLYATSRVKANTVISGTVQTDRLQGKTSSEVIYIGTGTCHFNVTGGFFRISSSNNYIVLTPTGRVAIYVGGVAKHVFMEDGTKRGGSIVIDDVNYGMSPIDSPEVLISDLIRNVKMVKGLNIINLDDLTAKAIDGYSVFFENSNGLTVTEKNKNSFTVKADNDVTTDIYLIGNRIEYKGHKWEKVTE
jgi:hypothetical protein